MVNPPRGVTLTAMHRISLTALALLTVQTVHCGGAVASDPTVVPPTQTVSLPEWKETASCEEIARTCKTDPALLVRGHAEGLSSDTEGARVEFAVRYVEDRSAFDVPHGVALGRTHVEGGSFSTCVCVPEGANMYPQVAAVVYRPGSRAETPADAIRATYSQRYATLGDEDVAYGLSAVPGEAQKSAAVAAMVKRTASVLLKNVGEGSVVAGIVADERPVASQLSYGGAEGSVVSLRWAMPGRASTSERVAFFIDKNTNGMCDAGDLAAFAPLSGAFDGKWLTDIKPVCDALQPDAPRE